MKTLGQQLQRQLGIVLKRIAEGGKVKTMRVDAEPYAGPVRVDCFFRFNRVESEREAAEAGEIIPSHQTDWPTARDGKGGVGDEDTLRRAVLDALTKSGVISDDSMSVGGWNFKRWTQPGEESGVLVVVRQPPAISDVLAMERALTRVADQ